MILQLCCCIGYVPRCMIRCVHAHVLRSFTLYPDEGQIPPTGGMCSSIQVLSGSWIHKLVQIFFNNARVFQWTYPTSHAFPSESERQSEAHSIPQHWGILLCDPSWRDWWQSDSDERDSSIHPSGISDIDGSWELGSLRSPCTWHLGRGKISWSQTTTTEWINAYRIYFPCSRP